MPPQLNEGIFLVLPQQGMQEGSEHNQRDFLVIFTYSLVILLPLGPLKKPLSRLWAKREPNMSFWKQTGLLNQSLQSY